MRIKGKNRSLLIKAAMGEHACDLTVSNVRYVNVFTGEIYPAEVDIMDGYVVRVRNEKEEPLMHAKEVLNGENHFLIPGFIDSHMHVESTMMIPENLSRAVVPWGTTTICTDPHEIGNVMGLEGISFMIENAKASSLRQYVLAPSCVPAVPGLENSGAEFTDKEIEQILGMEHVIGIAELMDYIGVYNDSERMHAIISKGIEKDVFLQGHAPFVTGKELAAYRIGGPCSDHESETTEEVIEKLRMGIHINLRASSLVNNLEELVKGIKQVPYHDFVSVCTDDVHAGDLLNLGHINKVVRLAIESGLKPVDAIRMATLNAAREFHFEELGAVAPGYAADFQLVEALDGGCPKAVFIGGKLVAQNGRYVGDDHVNSRRQLHNTMQVSWIKGAEEFFLYSKNSDDKTAKVNVIVPLDQTNVLRKIQVRELPVINGRINLDKEKDLAFVCVCNRHGKHNKTIAVIENFGLKEGAMGITISHDSHNLVLVYKNQQDAYTVLKKLESTGGGMCVAKDGKVLACMELPVAGLMSWKSCQEVSDEFDSYKQAFYQICKPETPLMSGAIMSLTALPGMIVTDCGLVDGNTQEIVDILL